MNNVSSDFEEVAQMLHKSPLEMMKQFQKTKKYYLGVLMSIDKKFIAEVFQNLDLQPNEVERIAATFELLDLKKGTILLHENEVVHDQYYVRSGCLRTYFNDVSGKEHTIQFAIKDWWISDYTAFFSTSKALLQIECIQDAQVYKISRNEMEVLYAEIPSLETFFRKKMEKGFAAFQKRILSNLSQPAKDRYYSFIKTYPNIEQSVKNYHIASYLGITTESLSRIRKEITS